MSCPAFDLARAEVEESADSGKEPDFVGASDGFAAENLVLSLDRVDAIAGEIRQPHRRDRRRGLPRPDGVNVTMPPRDIWLA